VSANRRRLTAAAIVLGAGLGGFLDGIVFHQLLQWHGTVSSVWPPEDVVATKINMYWDGVFHLGVWALSVIGVAYLYRAARHADTRWCPWLLVGGALVGWGAFNLVEGVLNHHVFRIHRVHEYAASPLAFDVAFLVFGAALVGTGLALLRRGWTDTGPAPGSLRAGAARDVTAPAAATTRRSSPSSAS
jgi:uncharacterized membrane protein